MEWLGTNNIPFTIAFTKTDKLNKTELSGNIDLYKREMMKYWEELPPIFLTSAKTGLGKDEILDYIGEVNKLYNDSF